MKLLTSTSSIRRMAWNACRSCSPDSDSMCADSLARCADAGCTFSPRCSRKSVTGDWVNHSHLHLGSELSQGVGDREVAADVPQADRRAQVEQASRATERERRVAAAGLCPPARRRSRGAIRFTRTGCRTCRRCPASGTSTSFPPVSSARRASLRPVEPRGHRCRARPARGSGRERPAHLRPGSSWTVASSVATRVSGSMSIAQADRVLDLLGGVGFRQQLAEEELRETALVAKPRVPVVALPALVDTEVVVEPPLGLVAGRAALPEAEDVRPERNPTEHALGMVGGEAERVPVAARQSSRGPPALCRSQSSTSSASATNSSAAYAASATRVVRTPVPAWVERDHPRVPGEVRHLRLPDPRRHDRPGG